MSQANSQQPAVIGVDLGGTSIKLGRFLPDGTAQASLTVATPQPSTPESVIDAIATAVQKLNSDHQVVALGVGVPGATDKAGRITKVAINLSGWQDVPVAEALEAKTGLSTILGNDANCAGLGEAWLGSGKAFQNLVFLTLGTGVGGAIILKGQLFTGHTGSAGELGLITLNPQGHPCNSGNNGSFEQHCSIGAIQRQWGKDPAELGQLAEQGDPEALSAWAEYGQLLGIGITSLLYVLTPEAVIIGGGISASGQYFLPSTFKEIEKRVLPSSRVNLQLLIAQLGNQAGTIGAGKLAWELYSAKG